MNLWFSACVLFVLVSIFASNCEVAAHALCTRFTATGSFDAEWSIDGLGIEDGTPDGVFEFRLNAHGKNMGIGGWLAVGFRPMANTSDIDIKGSWAVAGWLGSVINEYQVLPDGTLDRLSKNSNFLPGKALVRTDHDWIILEFQVDEDKNLEIGQDTKIDWRDPKQQMLFWYAWDNTGVPASPTDLKWPPANTAQRGAFVLNLHKKYGGVKCSDKPFTQPLIIPVTGNQTCENWFCKPCWYNGGTCPNDQPKELPDMFLKSAYSVTCLGCSPPIGSPAQVKSADIPSLPPPQQSPDASESENPVLNSTDVIGEHSQGTIENATISLGAHLSFIAILCALWIISLFVLVVKK